jgi:hypothetical protein
MQIDGEIEMKPTLVVLLLGSLLHSPYSMAADIYESFGSGKAEISSYTITEPRYGELHQGTQVLIFVPEDLNKKTLIKPDDFRTLNEKNKLPVFKMNRVLKFNTGIYDYSVMTTVFSSIKNNFKPAKISLSSSEWCGNVFAMLTTSPQKAKYVLHSYFESEGDKTSIIDWKSPVIYEDNLPILIRELQGSFLKDGESKNFVFVPSLWDNRKAHSPLAPVKGTLTKEKLNNLTRWQWNINGRIESYWTENDYPHYIVKWQNNRGRSGVIIKTMHLPYWSKHTLADGKLRKQLGL